MWFIESTSDKKPCSTSVLSFNSVLFLKKKLIFSWSLLPNVSSSAGSLVMGELVLAGGWANKTHNYSAVVLGFWCHFRKPWGVWEHPPKMAVLVDFAFVCVCVCVCGCVCVQPRERSGWCRACRFLTLSQVISQLWRHVMLSNLVIKRQNTLWVRLWNHVPTAWPTEGLYSPQHAC